LKFLKEVWAKRPWAGANEVELTKVPKSRERRRKKGEAAKKKGGPAYGRRPVVACRSLPFFEPCPYTWKDEIFQSSWSLEISFFLKMFLLLRLEYTWTFISTIGILVS
jgi:hypothetical protein